MTEARQADAFATDRGQIEQALRVLQDGGVVAVPTDTLFGLAADACNPDAIERVVAIKERPEGLALPVLLSGTEQLRKVADNVPEELEAVAEAFWPGAMTLIVNRNNSLPSRLTAGNPTVAVRVPDHPVPREMARRLGRPITGTSANLSGAADPWTLAELRAQVGDRVDFLVTVGPAPAGTASTIVDLAGGEPRLIREGAIPFQKIMYLLSSG